MGWASYINHIQESAPHLVYRQSEGGISQLGLSFSFLSSKDFSLCQVDTQPTRTGPTNEVFGSPCVRHPSDPTGCTATQETYWAVYECLLGFCHVDTADLCGMGRPTSESAHWENLRYGWEPSLRVRHSYPLRKPRVRCCLPGPRTKASLRLYYIQQVYLTRHIMYNIIYKMMLRGVSLMYSK